MDWETITSFVTDAFVGYGVPTDDAKICADVLLEADKRGIEFHGVNRFKPVYLDRIKAGIQNAVTKIEIVKQTHCVRDPCTISDYYISTHKTERSVQTIKKQYRPYL